MTSFEDLTSEEIERLKWVADNFSQRELERLKRIADEDEKREWAMAYLRKLGVVIFGLAAAFAAFREDLRTIFQAWWGR